MWMSKLFNWPFGCRLLQLPAAAIVAAFLLLSGPIAWAEVDFLHPQEAFKFSAQMRDPNTAEVTYKIADGYYMYRERFAFKADGAILGEPIIPSGKIKFDETFQKNVESHRGDVVIQVPVEADGSFTLTVTSQGCSDQGLCYAPIDSKATLSPGGGSLGTVAATAFGIKGSGVTDNAQLLSSISGSEMGRIAASLQSGELFAILPLFLLLGLGLAFTPCVLPMMPILSSIIVGEGGRISRGRGFALSAAYSLGMALVYTALGIAAGLAGEGLSAALQNPWMLGGFALLMVALSLSMFGVYQLQVPAAIQARLAKTSEGLSAGKLTGTFTMGAISALIVGPCVAAPLAGALLYISQTRDVVIGGSALFAMALGMSVPLLLLGASVGALLPRAGAWMESVKVFFGVLMLGLAAWILAPVIPVWVVMTMWAALGIGYGAYLLIGKRWGKIAKTVGIIFATFGLIQLIGLATGGRDALEPIAHLTGPHHKVEFQRIKSVDELNSVLAQTNGKTVMLDFYADWCVSCIEMEKLTFTDPRVQEHFAKMLLLQADVTANNDNDKALLKRFKLFGPPGIIFFDKAGREIPSGRVIGYQNADKFSRSLELVNGF
jgi:thiol:disulfide interchange protein DsbD